MYINVYLNTDELATHGTLHLLCVFFIQHYFAYTFMFWYSLYMSFLYFIPEGNTYIILQEIGEMLTHDDYPPPPKAPGLQDSPTQYAQPVSKSLSTY